MMQNAEALQKAKNSTELVSARLGFSGQEWTTREYNQWVFCF